MDKIKVEKIVNIFCENLNIVNNRYRNIIKELMINIIEKYEKCGIYEVEDKQQYLIKNKNNKYSIEDFFLNRLLFNVTSFEIKEDGERVYFCDYAHSITLNRNKLATILDVYIDKKFTDEEKYLAAKKVVMHEFEHALQTSYNYGPSINDLNCYKQLYKKLLNNNLNIELNEIYDGRKLISYIGDGNRKQSGLVGENDKDKYKKYYGTFWLDKTEQNYYSENSVNEIFNESESLLMSCSNEDVEKNLPSGNCMRIRNVESSNFLITNYGFMLKLLLGEKITFEGMYTNRDKIINFFNEKYEEIFKKVFKEHLIKKYPHVPSSDGWSILLMAIHEAKYSYTYGSREYSELCNLKLNLALSMCLEIKIKEEISNGKGFEGIKEIWNEFTTYCIYNNEFEKHNNLPHAQILYNLRENIKEQYKKNKNVAR